MLSSRPLHCFWVTEKCYFRTLSVTQNPMCFPNIKRICASKHGNDPNKIKVTGKKSHCKKTEILLKRLTPSGTLGSIMVLKIADTSIPIKEMVIILPVKIGKLNDKTVKLNLFPPSKIGNQPNIKSKSAAVAQDQYPSIKVYT